jgi:Protein of unknown function (DUF3300)
MLGAWLVLGLALIGLHARAQDGQTFSNEQLDQMLAPIALYPDALLSQVLMASTYPADVFEAATWSKANPTQKGDAAVAAVRDKTWDPSVASLVAFPGVIQQMGEHPEQVQRMGDALLAQPKPVMDSVQRLRAAARKAGNLTTTQQQSVITADAATGSKEQAIIIDPANPQVVHVPQYNPVTVYGSWRYPTSPPYYWPPLPGYVFTRGAAGGIAWGAGIGITHALWGGCNWNRGEVNINVNRFNSINVNRQLPANDTTWQHDPSYRRGVPYRDKASREKFGKHFEGADERADFRGKVDDPSAGRDRAQQTLRERGADPGRGREKMRNDRASRESARAAVEKSDRAAAVRLASQSDPHGHAFDNVNNVSAWSQQFERGNTSRHLMERTRQTPPAVERRR